MASDDHGYFLPTSAGLEPVSEASSPWSPEMLHGRLLAGLAARADGLAIGTCTLRDLDGPIGWSSVRAVANPVMGSPA